MLGIINQSSDANQNTMTALCTHLDSNKESGKNKCKKEVRNQNPYSLLVGI
jgi:hypothetical protein